MENKVANENKNANNKVDVLYNIWLETSNMFQTFQTGIGDDKYEELKRILEKKYGRTYTPEEAKEIGDGLLDFYILLMRLSN